MKKILAAIVEYKLTKKDLTLLVKKIVTRLNDTDSPYSDTFNSKMRALVREIQDEYHQDILSLRDEGCVMDVLKEMELLIVDYLSHSAIKQTNDCILH